MFGNIILICDVFPSRSFSIMFVRSNVVMNSEHLILFDSIYRNQYEKINMTKDD